MAVQNNYDPVMYDAPASVSPLGGMSKRTSDPRRDGYRMWQEPTSNKSGRTYLRKKDDTEGVDYLYDRVVSRVPVMTTDPITGTQRQKTTSSIFVQEPEPVFQTRVNYNRVKMAPGQNPRGYKPGEQPNAAKDQQGGGGSYAEKRSQVGRRGTVLTGSQGLGSAGGGDRKTVLGG